MQMSLSCNIKESSLNYKIFLALKTRKSRRKMSRCKRIKMVNLMLWLSIVSLYLELKKEDISKVD